MNRIKELRKIKKINQTELAKILNVQQGTISNWENGQTEIDFGSLAVLTKYFNVSTDYLLGREDTQPLHIPEILNTVNVAFKGGIDDLTQEDINAVADYVEFIRARKKRQDGKGE